MNKVAFIIIYNHHYTKNIEILENIYKDRFSNIYHLIPFYTGEKSNVIPVYESSYYFQGYVAQGLRKFFNEEYDHYFFLADDLIINPEINEKNYMVYFNLNFNTCFIPEFITLHERKEKWPRVFEAFHFNINYPGTEIKNLLPDYNTALNKFHRLNLEIKPLEYEQIWSRPKSYSEWLNIIKTKRLYSLYCLKNELRYIRDKFKKKSYYLPYPLVGSYSDIFIISKDAIKMFCHYCGIFAASKLFVEVAIPTSMVLAAQEISTENKLKQQGKALWPDGWARLNGDPVPAKDDFEELDVYQYHLKKLLQNFPEGYLYLHPIKLSQWNTEL